MKFTHIFLVVFFYLSNSFVSPSTVSPTSQPLSDFSVNTSEPLANFVWPVKEELLSTSGAYDVNFLFEKGVSSKWYIELQRSGDDAIVRGLIEKNDVLISLGFKLYEWGFSQQSEDGSIGKDFHSLSFFVEAVSHSLLLLRLSGNEVKYNSQFEKYRPLLLKAALWMIQKRNWERGMKKNAPYTHRLYLVATALGQTFQLTGEKKLLEYAHLCLQQAFSLQTIEGIHPELGGYDSGYQAVGIVYAQRYLANLPEDLHSATLQKVLQKALAWEMTRIAKNGEVLTEGNMRTGIGSERSRDGKVKGALTGYVFKAIAYQAILENNADLLERSLLIAKYAGWGKSKPFEKLKK